MPPSLRRWLRVTSSSPGRTSGAAPRGSTPDSDQGVRRVGGHRPLVRQDLLPERLQHGAADLRGPRRGGRDRGRKPPRRRHGAGSLRNETKGKEYRFTPIPRSCGSWWPPGSAELHRRAEEGELMAAKKICVFPGDGSARRSSGRGCPSCGHRAGGWKAAVRDGGGAAGGCAYDAHGSPMPDRALALAKASDAVLLGAVGGPKWDPLPFAVRPSGRSWAAQGAGAVREPSPRRRVRPSARRIPLRRELVEGIDLMVVRELTGGIYFGEPRGVSFVDGVETGSTRRSTPGPRSSGSPALRSSWPASDPGGSPPWTSRTSSRRRSFGARLCPRWERRSSPTWRSPTCWSTTARCSSSGTRGSST